MASFIRLAAFRFISTLYAVVQNHWLALASAFLVGMIYVLPHVVFMISLGDGYRGIPMMQTANEDEYLFRIQEIVDGHPLLGSPVFYEYKNQPPLSPPGGEFFYALPAMVLGVSPANVLIASRFFLPFILFLLIYIFIWQLTGGENIWSNTFNAIAGAFFITLGYDLVDYRSLWGALFGEQSFGSGFLLWSRPVNPILGAIFLFSFLICVWKVTEKKIVRALPVIGGAIFLALMIASYFFSWGIAVSVAGLLTLLCVLRKEYKTAAIFFGVLILGFLLASPYWYGAWRASQSPWYADSLLRSGLFYTHYPLLNKLLLLTFVFYFCVLLFDGIRQYRNGKIIKSLPERQWFCFAMLLGGLWAYNQQIITGRTVWPYHFVQYTIPLSIAVVAILMYAEIRKYSRHVWMAWVVVAIAASLTFGIYVQVGTYRNVYAADRDRQRYAPLFDWFNQQEKDCVVLTAGKSESFANFDSAIPAFTHCNLYDSAWTYSLMPEERIYHNLLVRLALDGATAESIEEYLEEHAGDVRLYLATNWKGLFKTGDFPDFSDTRLEERLWRLPGDFREFAKKDFKFELKKYRLDYIFINEAPLNRATSDLVKKMESVYNAGNFNVYRFR